MDQKVRVGINGYGVIGKRVADAVALQDDMEVAGVTYNHLDYRVRVAAEKGYPIYACSADRLPEDARGPFRVQGTLNDLIQQVDVMIECGAKGIGASNKRAYEKAGIKAIFQGGETHELAGVSFTAQVNYAEALNKQFARVVSCNTTGLCRVINALYRRDWVKKVRVVVMRRGSDPWESHRAGMTNTIVPDTRVPSHQGPDARTVIKGLNVVSLAGTVSQTLGHLHYAMVETTRAVGRDDVLSALWHEPRIAFVRSGDGIVGLNSVVELMRDLGRPRNDLWEVALWEDSVAVDSNEVFLIYQVHNEAITIPENIDAVRAMTGIETEAAKSIEKTDRALGIVKTFLPRSTDEQAQRSKGRESHTGSSGPGV